MKPFTRHFTPLILAAAAFVPLSAQANLRIDFTRDAVDVEPGWQGYIARHEQPADFVTQTFSAFGGTDNVTLTPAFAEALVQNPQMIRRSQVPPASAPLLFVDWTGIDNRDNNAAATGGSMTWTITGVPAGTYEWTSYHHDPENQTGKAILSVTDSTGTTDYDVDQSSGGGATAVPATLEATVVSDGSDIIVKLEGTEVGPTTGITVWNGFELIDPDSLDSDDDGLDDLWEDLHFGNNNGIVEPEDLTLQSGTDDGYPAPDGDGLDNIGEQDAGTDPNDPDSDLDNLSDGDEVTGELNPYLDGVLRPGFDPSTFDPGDPTDPMAEDSDGDTLFDDQEISGELNPWIGTNPDAPADGDPTNPNSADSDGDTFPDVDEIDGFVTDPEGTQWSINAARADSDGDGVDDDVEIANIADGWDPTVDDSGEDFDNDGLITSGELDEGTDVTNPDTDGDGLLDGAEVNTYSTLPLVVDTDGDLISDGDEVNNSSDPLDPDDFPSVPHLQITFAVDPDGPVEAFYQPYLAINRTNSLDSDPVGGDPLGMDRLSEAFAAFGSTVNLSVSYPDLDRLNNTEDQLNLVKVMFNRSDGQTANYLGTKDKLMRTWIGVDGRASQGGNGLTTPTTLRLQLDGVPAGTYRLRTYHHDVELQHGLFSMRVTDADSDGELLSDRFHVTQSSGTVLNNQSDPGAGNGPELLRSTVEQVIHSNGSDPIILDVQAYESDVSDDRVSMAALNGLELEIAADTDNDDVLDDIEIAIWGDLTTSSGSSDVDGDGLTDLEEILVGLDPTGDTDGDGFADSLELDNGLAVSGEITSTVIEVPAAGSVTLSWEPAGTADIEAGSDLQSWPELIAGQTSPATFPVPASLVDSPTVFFRVLPPPAGFGTNPWVADSDADSLSDGDEVNIHGSNPLSTESDGDGFTDDYEVATGAKPGDANDVPDNDGDGYHNAREVAAGSDPLDPASVPQPAPDTFLFIDFNSTTQDGGPHPQTGYQSYDAGHEVAADFVFQDYNAFGATVSIVPEWPDTTDNRVMQMIDRAAGNDNQWQGDNINLLTDWLGVDTRTGNGGNGDYAYDIDTETPTGTPSSMDLVISGLPAGTYSWTSFHHDTEHVWADFLVEIDNGTTFSPPQAVLPMTNSSGNPNPAPGNRHQGYLTDPNVINPADLPSTFRTTFTADGVSDVIIRFTPITDTAVHRQLFAINGFELIKQP